MKLFSKQTFFYVSLLITLTGWVASASSMVGKFAKIGEETVATARGRLVDDLVSRGVEREVAETSVQKILDELGMGKLTKSFIPEGIGQQINRMLEDSGLFKLGKESFTDMTKFDEVLKGVRTARDDVYGKLKRGEVKIDQFTANDKEFLSYIVPDQATFKAIAQKNIFKPEPKFPPQKFEENVVGGLKKNVNDGALGSDVQKQVQIVEDSQTQLQKTNKEFNTLDKMKQEGVPQDQIKKQKEAVYNDSKPKDITLDEWLKRDPENVMSNLIDNNTSLSSSLNQKVKPLVEQVDEKLEIVQKKSFKASNETDAKQLESQTNQLEDQWETVQQSAVQIENETAFFQYKDSLETLTGKGTKDYEDWLAKNKEVKQQEAKVNKLEKEVKRLRAKKKPTSTDKMVLESKGNEVAEARLKLKDVRRGEVTLKRSWLEGKQAVIKQDIATLQKLKNGEITIEEAIDTGVVNGTTIQNKLDQNLLDTFEAQRKRDLIYVQLNRSETAKLQIEETWQKEGILNEGEKLDEGYKRYQDEVTTLKKNRNSLEEYQEKISKATSIAEKNELYFKAVDQEFLDAPVTRRKPVAYTKENLGTNAQDDISAFTKDLDANNSFIEKNQTIIKKNEALLNEAEMSSGSTSLRRQQQLFYVTLGLAAVGILVGGGALVAYLIGALLSEEDKKTNRARTTGKPQLGQGPLVDTPPLDVSIAELLKQKVIEPQPGIMPRYLRKVQNGKYYQVLPAQPKDSDVIYITTYNATKEKKDSKLGYVYQINPGTPAQRKIVEGRGFAVTGRTLDLLRLQAGVKVAADGTQTLTTALEHPNISVQNMLPLTGRKVNVYATEVAAAQKKVDGFEQKGKKLTTEQQKQYKQAQADIELYQKALASSRAISEAQQAQLITMKLSDYKANYAHSTAQIDSFYLNKATGSYFMKMRDGGDSWYVSLDTGDVFDVSTGQPRVRPAYTTEKNKLQQQVLVNTKDTSNIALLTTDGLKLKQLEYQSPIFKGATTFASYPQRVSRAVQTAGKPYVEYNLFTAGKLTHTVVLKESPVDKDFNPTQETVYTVSEKMPGYLNFKEAGTYKPNSQLFFGALNYVNSRVGGKDTGAVAEDCRKLGRVLFIWNGNEKREFTQLHYQNQLVKLSGKGTTYTGTIYGTKLQDDTNGITREMLDKSKSRQITVKKVMKPIMSGITESIVTIVDGDTEYDFHYQPAVIADIRGLIKNIVQLAPITDAFGITRLVYRIPSKFRGLKITPTQVQNVPANKKEAFANLITKAKIVLSRNNKHILYQLQNDDPLGSKLSGWSVDLYSGVLYDALGVPQAALNYAQLQKILSKLQVEVTIDNNSNPQLWYQGTAPIKLEQTGAPSSYKYPSLETILESARIGFKSAFVTASLKLQNSLVSALAKTLTYEQLDEQIQQEFESGFTLYSITAGSEIIEKAKAAFFADQEMQALSINERLAVQKGFIDTVRSLYDGYEQLLKRQLRIYSGLIEQEITALGGNRTATVSSDSKDRIQAQAFGKMGTTFVTGVGKEYIDRLAKIIKEQIKSFLTNPTGSAQKS